MNIRNAAYQLCKSVWRSPEREELKSLLFSLHHYPDANTSAIDRSHLGYTAREIGNQLLGYLIVDRDKDDIEQTHLPLKLSPPLDEAERRLIAGAHKEIVELNKLCVTPFTQIYPQYANTINPYNHFNYQIPEDFRKVSLFSEEALNLMVQTFHKHPAFITAIDNGRRIDQEMIENEIGQGVINIETAILKAGTMNAPQGLRNLVHSRPEGTQDRITFRFLSSLVCIRASLSILNDLIFQAVISKKLELISDDNVILLGSLTGHFCGRGISFICQADENINPFSLGLALVKCSFLDFPVDLCRKEKIRLQVSAELGEVVEVHLRIIDEDLNPYDNLLQNFLW